MPKIKKTTTQKPLKKDQVAELTADLQRVQADFENYKKRVAAERAELLSTAKLSVLSDLLPTLDNFDRAATHLPEHLQNDAWAQGMSYVGTQLEQILDEIGVKKFDPTGQDFNAAEHEAIERVESEQPEGKILETTLPGYRIAGRVVRPATVRVSAGQHTPDADDAKSPPDEETRDKANENVTKKEKNHE
jgi:molecular chaperone GrpE